MKAKVKSLISSRSGKAVPNQFEIETDKYYIFQSYNSTIAVKSKWNYKVILDPQYWDYSATTLKYLKQFLGINSSKKEIENYIEQGIYETKNLNK
tara:strand:+ start:338 stop:622 length:285 start_codon:yes stop_codon:yes gene_type:complete